MIGNNRCNPASVWQRMHGFFAGIVLLVRTDRQKIIIEASRLLEDNSYYRHVAQAGNPYGDGNAAKRIVDALIAY